MSISASSVRLPSDARALKRRLPALVLLALVLTARGQTHIDLRTQSKSVDFSASSSTRPFKTGTAFPATCNIGEIFYQTTALPGKNLFACTATNIWSTLAPLLDIPPVSPNSGKVLSNDGTVLSWRTDTVSAVHGRAGAVVGQSGDYTFGQIAGALNASQINPSDKQGTGSRLTTTDTSVKPASTCAQWDAGGNLISTGLACGSGGSGGGQPNYSQNFTSQTSVTLTHSLGTTNVLVQCYNTAENAITPSQVTVVNAGSASVSFASAQSGRCVVNGSGGGGGGGGAIVGGLGVVLAGSNPQVLSVDTATVPSFLVGTASLDFGPISDASCTQLTFSLPGAATGDSIAAGWPHLLAAGLLPTMLITSPNVVTVQLCNLSGGSIDPPNLTYRATLVRSF